MAIPEMTPVSFLKYVQVSGYQRKGGKWVSGYLRKSWVVSFPVPLDELDLTDFGREKFPPRPAADPAPSVARESPRSSWQNIQDFILDLYDEFSFFELTDPLYRFDEENDVINLTDKLVWDRPLKTRTMREAKLREIDIVRVWVLLYNRNTDSYVVFARSRSLRLSAEPTRKSFEAAYAECLDIYEGVVSWAETETDYMEVRDLIGWTAWGLPTTSDTAQKAPWSQRK